MRVESLWVHLCLVHVRVAASTRAHLVGWRTVLKERLNLRHMSHGTREKNQQCFDLSNTCQVLFIKLQSPNSILFVLKGL